MRSVAVNENGARIGHDHHNARYTNGEVEMLHGLRDQGLGYGRIAKIMEMPKATVASICSGRRRCQTVARWKQVQE